MKDKILFVLSMPNQAKRFWGAKEFSDYFETISHYELNKITLDRYKAIIFSMYIDQYILNKEKDKLKIFIKNGGKVFFNGHIILPFFEELKSFIPMNRPTLDEFKIVKLKEHTIYKDINLVKLSKRKGVAGFFSRGGNPPPENSNHIIAVKGGDVIVDWEYKIGEGIIYVHSGNDLWTCMLEQSDNSLLFKNIVAWIQEGEEYE